MREIFWYLKYLPKILFILFIVKPVVNILLGVHLKNKHLLPKKGPVILVANHNSHLDVPVIMAIFPMRLWHKLRPVGAQDYFFKNKVMHWFSRNIIDVLPICRKGEVDKEHILEPCEEALNNNDIIILFPEGTRGQPEHLGELRKGIWHLAKNMPHVPIVPIYLHGLGKALPKGEGLLVPFFVDVVINKGIYFNSNSDVLLSEIRQSFLEPLS